MKKYIKPQISESVIAQTMDVASIWSEFTNVGDNGLPLFSFNQAS